MFVKCHGVRFGSRGDVLSGRYGPRAACLKWSAVLVFPGGLRTAEWPYSCGHGEGKEILGSFFSTVARSRQACPRPRDV